ncbi:snoRNA-binding rRNA-processing protein [Tulasnella sp. 424]|nr:snoRNA-binding rRNA-processing protein [Tulasnella sp. 424]KAG8981985.1 snoRNA-binding rRNA-processing protein [Tulasnella sp. 425]
MPRAGPASTQKRQDQRHNPLHVELARDEEIAKYGKVTSPGRRKKKRGDSDESEEEGGERFLDAKTSKRILNLAKKQQEEEAVNMSDRTDDEEEEEEFEDEETAGPSISAAIRSKPTFDEDESENEAEDLRDGFMDEEYVEELQIDEQDMQTLDKFLPSNVGERKTLADLIFSQFESGDIEAGKRIKVAAEDNGPPDPAEGLDPKVVEVYKKVGQLMNRYRSGPLPKPLKILPALPSWARLLAITEPRMWTPHAFNAATKILIANLKPSQARIYLESVLLPCVRENMEAHQGKLNVQLYEAVQKGTFKPAAFFKGILFPLVEEGCTLKEASVFASILQKTSIPILHSAAALLRLASMDYTGPVSLFIRVLLDKKYALPYKVVDGMVFHFIRIANTFKPSRNLPHLPVLWHQSLLVFVQRYGSDLTPEQKDALLDVVKARPHAQIGPEIRRHIVNSVVRGEPRPMPDGDIIMS